MRYFILLLFLIPSVYSQTNSECDDWETEHPDWIACEDFEFGDGNWTIWYENTPFHTGQEDDRGRITLDENSYQGNHSLYMPALPSSDYEGATLSFYDCVGDDKYYCETNGYEQLYFRSYIRFHEDHEFVHHFMNIGGNQLDRSKFWDSHGLAGCRPNGEISAGTTVDFSGDTRDTFFYTYSVDMNCDPGWSCDRYSDATRICSGCADRGLPCNTNGEECCWGNHYERDEDAPLPVGEWICLEMMMKLNTPGESDGEMAYWIDGDFIHSEDTMFWRTIPELQLNKVHLQHYIPSDDIPSDDPVSNKMWWDNAIVSTDRIGCLDYVPVSRCTPGDSDRDGAVSAIEMGTYFFRYLSAEVSIQDMIEVVLGWKNGC